MFKRNVIIGVVLIFISVLVYTHINVVKNEDTIDAKTYFDKEAQRRFDIRYENDFENDLKKWDDNGKVEIPKKYWKEIKEKLAEEVTGIEDIYPELTIGKKVVQPYIAQNEATDLDKYLIDKGYATSPLIGVDVQKICKDSGITDWQCKIGLAIFYIESKFGTAYHKNNDLGLTYHNYAGLKCDTGLSKMGKNCKFPDENGMYLVKFNSTESFLKYFYSQILGVNWKACNTAMCFSYKYVGDPNTRSLNWEQAVNNILLDLWFINY